MAAYVRCSSLHCFTSSVEYICDIPVCAEHARALREAIQPVVKQTVTDTGSVVYYVTWRDKDVVKIGVTQNITMRLRNLSTMKSRAILMASEPGGYYLEKKRHRQFAHLRIAGTEMFRYVPQLAEHIATLT